MKQKKYRALSVSVQLEEERRSSWAWQGRKIKGTEYLYRAMDENFDRLNEWIFSVRVPNQPGQIVVQPQTVPGKKVFAQVARRPITFQQATKRPFRKHAYCKLHLAD